MPIRQSKSVGVNSCANKMEDLSNKTFNASSSSALLLTFFMPIEKEPSGIFRIKGVPSCSVISSYEFKFDLNSNMESGAGIFSFSNNSFR